MILTEKQIKTVCFRLAKATSKSLNQIQAEMATALGYENWNAFHAAHKEPKKEQPLAWLDKLMAKTKIVKILFSGPEGDSHLLLGPPTGNPWPLAETRDHETLFTDDEIITITFESEQKFDEVFGEEKWNYDDCWRYIGTHGLSNFVQTFKGKMTVPEKLPEAKPKNPIGTIIEACENLDETEDDTGCDGCTVVDMKAYKRFKSAWKSLKTWWETGIVPPKPPTKKHVVLIVPQDAWDTIEETLECDRHSRAFDAELREEIGEAIDKIHVVEN